MELSSTIAQPLTSNATSLKPELDDKSFDLGDDTGLDVQAALGPFYKPSHSLPAEPVASTSQVTLDDVQSDDDGEAEEDAAMEARIAELEADAFSDDIAEDMIADLKEIGMFRSLRARCPLIVTITQACSSSFRNMSYYKAYRCRNCYSSLGSWRWVLLLVCP